MTDDGWTILVAGPSPKRGRYDWRVLTALGHIAAEANSKSMSGRWGGHTARTERGAVRRARRAMRRERRELEDRVFWGNDHRWRNADQ